MRPGPTGTRRTDHNPTSRHAHGGSTTPVTRGREPMAVVQEPVANGNEMTALLAALTALKQGRTGVRLPIDWTGVAGKVADAFNEVVGQNERLAEELARLSRVVGKEGRLSQRLSVGDVSGFWRE